MRRLTPQQAAQLLPGPGSVTWRRATDVRTFLAAGYALLLQVAHPAVGAGVRDHSNYREDPWGRLPAYLRARREQAEALAA